MNYFQAHKLLDEVKDGRDHTTANISIALELVGDIDSGVCGTGTGWGRSSPEGWQEGVLDKPLQRT
jgi:hypothetical protein